MTLPEFIAASGGAAVLSRKLKLNISSVYRWSIGDRPSPAHMIKIEKLSKGQVTISSMVRGER